MLFACLLSLFELPKSETENMFCVSKLTWNFRMGIGAYLVQILKLFFDSNFKADFVMFRYINNF